MNRTNKMIDRCGALALVLLTALTAGTATAATGQPTIRAVAGFETARAAGARRDLERAPTTIVTEKADERSSFKSATASAQSAGCCAHYVYSGFTEVFDDRDYDGFHSYLRVNVDIDTDFYESDLYVEVYLRGSVGNWVMIFESDVFTIHGTSAFDDYEIESELLSGFAPDYYDVLVEVYDAYTGDRVASYGPLEDSSFAVLPLEDVNRDAAVAVPVVNSYGSGGGGSLSVGVLLLLTVGYVLRQRRPYSDSATRNLSSRTMSSRR